VPWQHVLAAVAAHTDAAWVLLYVQRWLAAPLQHPDGTMIERERGTPQGSPVSPVLANLFLHYALDVWLTREHPGSLQSQLMLIRFPPLPCSGGEARLPAQHRGVPALVSR
jgi:retron-type reverse transcriptase